MENIFNLKSIIINNTKILYNVSYNTSNYTFFVNYYNLHNIKLNGYSEGIVSLLFIICLNNNIRFSVNKNISIHQSLIENLEKLELKMNKKGFVKNMCMFNNINTNLLDKNNLGIIIPATGGVDSSSSIIKYRESIDVCIFILGYDIKMDKTDKKWIDICINNLKKTMGICLKSTTKLLICETNIWDILIYDIQKNHKIDCGIPNYAQGASTCAIVYPLADSFSKFIMSGPGIGDKYKTYMKAINRSELEEYFSSDILEVKVDDNLSRHEKINFIYKNYPEILKNLRICCKWNSYGGLNCNECEKCLRTILICNLLELSHLTTFPKLSIQDIDKLYNKFNISLTKTNDRYTYLRQLEDLYNIFIKYKSSSFRSIGINREINPEIKINITGTNLEECVVPIKNYKIRYNFYKDEKYIKYNKNEYCSINNNNCIMIFQNELEKLIKKDDNFIYNDKIFDYSNNDTRSKVANTLHCFDINEITHKMLFAHHFKNKLYRPLTYIVSLKTNTIYKRYCDFITQSEFKKNNSLKHTDKFNWFCKPPGLSAGKGIIITKKPDELYNKSKDHMYSNIYIIEKEIVPLLNMDRKFDFRIHMLIVYENQELSLYFPNNFLTRFACNIFNEHDNSYGSKLTNLTIKDNTTIDNSNYSFYDIFNTHPQKTQILKNIKYILYDMKSTVLNNLIDTKYRSKYILEYHLVGLDIILDKNLKPYILEINKNPDLFDNFANSSFTGTKINKNSKILIQDLIIKDILKIIKKSYLNNTNLDLEIFDKLV